MNKISRDEILLIKQATFVLSAYGEKQFPEDDIPQVAFVGRSNCGKSSLINYLTNRKKLAKTSQTPGKTRAVNFFTINDAAYFVDLPGYGFARLSKKEKGEWQKLLESYLASNSFLKGVVLILDCRRVPSPEDIMMKEWLEHYGVNIILALSKTDKISWMELKKNKKKIFETFNIKPSTYPVFGYSALKRKGRTDINTYLLDILGLPLDKSLKIRYDKSEKEKIPDRGGE